MRARTAILILFLAVHSAVLRLTEAEIDLSICNPLATSTDPTPMPQLAESFTTNVEWKWLDRNMTIDVAEVHNSIVKMSSQSVEQEGQTTLLLYDFQESQYITYTPDGTCSVTGLGTFAFYDGKVWLTATSMIYDFVQRAGPVLNGTSTVRSTSVLSWQACLDLYQFNITLDVKFYFSANGWGMAMSAPNQMIPVRIEMRGSQNYNKNSTADYTTWHLIGDFIDYNPVPSLDTTQLQLPSGVFCPGRKSRKPLELFPESFSLVMEKIDMDFHRVTYEYIWYDAVNRLVRRDSKEALNQDPDPVAEVFDFNLGIHYSIDKYMGTCEPISLLTYGDLFVRPMGNSSRMEDTLEYFRAKNAMIQYVGSRTTRGVACDVWVGKYPDDTTGTNVTVEWYFTKDDWVTAIGGVIQSQTLFRMDVWEGGSNKPIVYNVLQLDKDAPSLSVFDISLCYQPEHKTRILVHFSVVNGGKLSSVGLSYLTDTMHLQLTSAAFIPPLRLTDLSVVLVGDTDLYVDAVLLDNAPLENNNLVPPPPKQHPLSGVLGFLTGTILGGYTISLNSTIQGPVVIQSQAIQEINYAKRFTTSAPTTTLRTTLATPPAPIDTPTVKTPPIPPMTVPQAPSTIPPLTSQQTPCPMCPSCPTCPTVRSCAPCQTPVCPTQTPCPRPTPCPKITCQACKPCSTTACPTTTCVNKTCPACPAQKHCPQPPSCPPPKQCATERCSCPIATPCPQSHVPIPQPGEQTGNKDDGTKGLSGGVVAAIAIVMLIVGLLGGVIGVRLYERYRQTLGSERKTILDNYLNDNERY